MQHADAPTKKQAAPAKHFQGRAFKGASWDADSLTDFLANVTSGKAKLARLSKYPSIAERLPAKRAGDTGPKRAGDTGPKRAGDTGPKAQDSSKPRRPAKTPTSPEPARRPAGQPAERGSRQPEPTSARRHRVEIGRDGSARKSWEARPEAETEDKAAEERRRERERRKQVSLRPSRGGCTIEL